MGEPRLIFSPLDGVPGVLLGLGDLGGEVLLEGVQPVDVDRDAGALHPREHARRAGARRRQAAARTAGRGDLLVEHVGEVAHGGCAHHLLLGRLPRRRRRRSRACPVRRSCDVPAQLAVQVAQDEVVEVVGALVGLDEVGRQLGVARQPGHRPSPGRRAPRSVPWRRAWPSVGPRPRARRHGRLSLGRSESCRSIHAAEPSGRPRRHRSRRRSRAPTCRRRRARLAGPPARCSATQSATASGASDRSRRRRSRTRPREPLASTSAKRRSRRTRNSRRSKTSCTSSRLHCARSRSARRSTPTGASLTSWLSRRLRSTWSRWSRSDSPGLALDLVDARDDALEVAELGDPLRGRLGADARHAREVVGGLADHRGEVAVAGRAARRTSPRPVPGPCATPRRRRGPGRGSSRLSETSWKVSRSPEQMRTSTPWASACVAMVAMMSSAS